MSTLAHHLGLEVVPQSEALPGQVQNNAGGYAFAVDDWARLQRFLILGSEGGTYYVSERKLTLDNAKCVNRCLDLDAPRALSLVLQISTEGRAPKNEPALMALALAMQHASSVTRQLAGNLVPQIARTGTHIFHLADYIKALGGWKRKTKRAFQNWYLDMPEDRLALQVIKYQQRDGWAHADLLRKSHPKTTAGSVRNEIFHYAVDGWEGVGVEPHSDSTLVKIWAFERAKALTSDADVRQLCDLITQYGLPHECVPNQMKKYPAVWEAMLPHMGITAMIRNLGKMTSIGLVAPLSAASKYVAETISDIETIRKGRVHPIALLVALKTYAQGHGDKGKLSWSAVQTVVNALDGAFYTSFKAVEPTGKNHLLGVDISGSMFGADVAGTPLKAAEVAAAMALVTVNVEPNCAIFGFCTAFQPLKISARSRLDDVVRYMRTLHMGNGTDCAQPMTYATENKLPVDAFFVYTDNESWAGPVHASVAIKKYRQKMGRPAKSVVVATAATEYSIADPNDAGMMDVVGFDTGTPAVMADYIRG